MLQVLYADQPPPTGSSGHVTPYLDVANTWSAAQTIDIGANLGTALTLRSSETSVTGAPDLLFDRVSTQAAFTTGRVAFRGSNSAAVMQTFARIHGVVVSNVSGAEYGQVAFLTQQNGAFNTRMLIGGGLYTNGAAGGDKGLDTINATTLYEAGVALTAKYGQLGVNNAWTANQTITTVGPGTPLLITNTDPGAVAGPNLDIFRDSASPAVNDSIGQIRFLGRDNSNAQITFSSLLATLYDPTTGASTGGLAIRTVVAGATANRLNVSAGVYTAGAGGDMGVNTINALALYESGNPISARYVGGAGSGNILRRNGGLEIWQRGAGGSASFALTANTITYTADGWYLVTGANEAFTVSQQPGLTNGSQWSAKFQRNAGQTGTANMWFGFPLDTDEIYPALGQYVLLSFTAKAGANWSGASIAALIRTGTATPAKVAGGTYTGVVDVISQNFIPTTTTTRYQFISPAVVPTTTRQMELLFPFSPVGTAGADDSVFIDDVQLEIVPAATGYVASAFQRLSFTEQLLLCQRHYWKTFSYNVAPASNVGTGNNEFRFAQAIGASLTQQFNLTLLPVPMRVSPTITTYNPSGTGANIYNPSLVAPWTSTSGASNGNSVWVTGVTPVGSSSGQGASVHITADAGI